MDTNVLETSIYASMIGLGLAILYNIYMAWLNHKQAKAYDILVEIRDILKERDKNG